MTFTRALKLVLEGSPFQPREMILETAKNRVCVKSFGANHFMVISCRRTKDGDWEHEGSAVAWALTTDQLLSSKWEVLERGLLEGTEERKLS